MKSTKKMYPAQSIKATQCHYDQNIAQKSIFFFKINKWIMPLKALWKCKNLLFEETLSISIFQWTKRGNFCHILWCNTMIPWILSFDRITSERITCRKLIQKSFFFLSTLSRIGKKGQQKSCICFNDNFFWK